MVRMVGICLLVPLLAMHSSLPARGAEPPRECRILGVEDAATYSVRCGARIGTLRVPGVRAPRAGPPQLGGEPFAEESGRRAEAWLDGRAIGIETRPGEAAVVRLEGADLAKLLLRRGWVYLGRDGTRPGPTYEEAERHARGERLGVWSEEAWKDLQDRLTDPVSLEPPAPPPAAPALGERSRGLTGKPWKERKAAFDEAVRELGRKVEG